MAIQLSTALRNARLDQIESSAGFNANATVGGILTIWTGTVPANCAAANAAETVLVTILLPLDAFGDAAAGAKAKSGTWQDASADATGTAAHFRVHQATAPTVCALQGTVGQGSGDLQLDNTSIAVGQQVTVTTFTLTDGNA